MSARWQQVKEILQAALERSPDEREQFLDKVCADDESLRREVETLLLSAEHVGSFMEQAAIGKVAEMFVGAENDLPIGERFNHYKILSRLGAGGMGEVYLAEDTRLHRRVALKLLPQSLSSNQNANRRLLREAQAAAALDHPHICQIHEIAETDGRSFIVMQFCEGETLAEKLERENLNLRETLDLAIQIADALANAHSHHVIHRDIKPANIIVNEQGQARILDFGLAKIIAEKLNVESEAETAQLLSAANMIIGTAPYMSPEQVRGNPLDARTDIFSFGVVLYEMLSGKQVFSRESHAETISAVLSYEPPIAKTLADTPPELQRIVRKSLAKDKEERYQTAKDLLIDLQNVKQELDFQNKFGVGLSEPPAVADGLSVQTRNINAEVSISNVQPPATAGGSDLSAKARPFWLIILLLSLLIPAVGFFAYRYFTMSRQIESIAVMPFGNESGNADVEYLSDGMTETLISSLSQIPKLNVKARSSVFRYKGKDTDANTIGKQLNVQAILNGTVVQRGQDLALHIELVDAQTEIVLWSEDYKQPMANLVSLQSDITRDVSSKLKIKLTGADEQKLVKNYTENAEAYQFYLRGRYFWNKRTADGIKKAIEQFQQAIDRDPNYALGYVGLADSYVFLHEFGDAPASEMLPKARAAADRALQLDDSLSEAHTSSALIYRNLWHWAEAEEEFKRAVSLNPNYSTARIWFSIFFRNKRQFDDALREIKRAQELDPLSPVISANLAYVYVLKNDPNSAVEQCQRMLEIDPNVPLTHDLLGIAYLKQQRYEEATAEFQKAVELSKRAESRYLSSLGYCYAIAGRRSEALAILKELEEKYAKREASGQQLAGVYAGLGDRDQAFARLERDFERRSIGLPEITWRFAFDGLRDDPRYKDLLRRIDLQP